MLFYRVNYFIAVIASILILIKLNNIILPLSNLFFLTFFFLFILKPIIHLFALKNKRNKKNIYLYKNLYGENTFKKSSETIEIQEKMEKRLSKGMTIGIILAYIIILAYTISLSLDTVKVMIEQKYDIKAGTINTNKNSFTQKEKQDTKIILPEEINTTELIENKDRLIEKTESNSNELNEEIKNNFATILGTDIIMRKGHSAKSKIVGSFKYSGEKVVILETYTSEKQIVLIKNEIIVNDREGEDNTLQKGKSVKVIAINEEPPIEILISFKNKKGKTKEGLVSENDLDYTNEFWCKVRRDNGEIGWVFGKFIKMI